MSCKHITVASSTTTRLKSRQLETARIKCQQPCHYIHRPTSAHNIIAKITCNSNDTKRVCGSENTPGTGKRRSHRRVYLGAPRCTRVVPNLLPPMFDYVSYGRSTDHNSDVSNSARTQLHNPYSELAKEVSLAIRVNEENLTQSQTPTAGVRNPPTEGDNGRGPLKVDIQIKENPATGNGTSYTADENILRAQAEHDDDADDEDGIVQAHLSESQGLTTTQLDMFKVLHQAKMEEISKLVRPRKLMSHLQNAGYFNHNYSSHARTTADNLNLKQGHKKSIERLLALLSIH